MFKSLSTQSCSERIKRLSHEENSVELFPSYFEFIILFISGTRASDEDGRSKSSLDVRDGDSPPLSRRKKMWHSFRRKIRSRSRDKSRGESLDDETDGNISAGVDHENPDGTFEPMVFDGDVAGSNGAAVVPTNGNNGGHKSNNTPEKKKNKKNKSASTSTLERKKGKSKSLDLEEKHEKEGREKDKESEGDSGIAVVENPVSI